MVYEYSLPVYSLEDVNVIFSTGSLLPGYHRKNNIHGKLMLYLKCYKQNKVI